jgi:hypothetical protein
MKKEIKTKKAAVKKDVPAKAALRKPSKVRVVKKALTAKDVRIAGKDAEKTQAEKMSLPAKGNPAASGEKTNGDAKKNPMPARKGKTKKAGGMRKNTGEAEEKVAGVQEEDEYFVKWTGKSFIPRQWEKSFYQVCLIASAAVVLWSISDGSWLQAVTFLALAATLVLELKDEPRDIGYEINIDGIVIDGKLYRFEDIRSFDLGKKNGFDVIKLRMKHMLLPMRELHLAEGQDVLYIETLLEYFLPKEAHKDTLFDFGKKDEKNSEELAEEEFINKKVDEYLKGQF